MLFDLRSAGRRRTVKVIYVTLAILMGGGLVLFGIGGNVSGGLVDAITGGGGGGGGNDTLAKEEKRWEQRVVATPRDARAWAELARVRYQRAGQGDNYDQARGAFTDKGRTKLREVEQAWDRYLALEPKKPDDRLATLMVQAFGPFGLNKPDKAVGAQEIVVDARPRNANLFFRLALLAYQAGQTRKGDLAARKTLELTPKDLRSSVKEQLDQAKKQGALPQGDQAQTQPSG